jgi:monovalent cation:H+ antiporter-2, CPA2 family
MLYPSVAHLDLILTITGGLAAALVFGFLMHRIGLSPVVGYLLAGIAVGPRTPGFVAHEGLAAELAEIGVILLMFGVGLQFHIKELLAVRRIALPGALGQIAAATGLGALAARSWGYGWPGAVVFGLAISVASTVVLVRVLSDHRDLHTPVGRTAVGWLVVEDIFTVLALVGLPLVFQNGASGSRALGLSLGLALLKLLALGVAVLVIGRRLVPTLFEYVARTRSRELFTLTVLVSALGIAVGSAKFFGASMALGAFLAGLIVGQSEFSARAAADALPMRDAFAVLFFVSVGMMFDPAHLLNAPGQVAITLAIVLIAKPLSAWLIVRALGQTRALGAPVAAALSQIGEFSFVLASSSEALGILPREAASTLVATSILSVAASPILYGAARRLAARSAASTTSTELAGAEAEHTSAGRDLAVVVGYGPTGQVVHEILAQNHIDVMVVDLNMESVRTAREQGGRGLYGDAGQREVLAAAGMAQARALFLTAASQEGAAAIIQAAKSLNPSAHVYVRASYLAEVGALRAAGAASVVAAEGEVAVAMATQLLEHLGASPDHIDRERDRVYLELGRRTEPGPALAQSRRHGSP